jgi:hypothetical protein
VRDKMVEETDAMRFLERTLGRINNPKDGVVITEMLLPPWMHKGFRDFWRRARGGSNIENTTEFYGYECSKIVLSDDISHVTCKFCR